MTEEQTIHLLVNFMEKIDKKVDAIADKIDDNSTSLRNEIAAVKASHEKLQAAHDANTHCRGPLLDELKRQTDQNKEDIYKLKLENEKSEWKIFFSITLKLAAFITAIGGAVILLYQAYLELVVKHALTNP